MRHSPGVRSRGATGRARRRGARLGGLALLVLLPACNRAPSPGSVGDSASAIAEEIATTDSLPELPLSVLDLPVEYDLDPAVAALEAAVPRTFGDIAERRRVASNDRLSIAFAAKRSPFAVSVRGNTATISSLVTYEGKGWYRLPLAPDVSGSCGTGFETPRLRIVLSTSVSLQPDWTLRARTRVPVVEPATDSARDRCRVTVVKYDVTDRVLGAARGQLEGKAAVVDQRIRRIDVRSRVTRWWALLHRPIRIRDSVWLEIRPAEIRLGPPRAEEGNLVAPLRLAAAPRIVTGPRPDTTPTPLPPLVADTAGQIDEEDGLRMIVEAALEYDEAERILASKLVGRKFEHRGRRIELRSVSVAPARGGRIALRFGFVGDAEGAVRFVGRPAYDSASGEVRVPDLEYDVSSENVVVNGLVWLKRDDIRDVLRARARWPALGLIDMARKKVEQALNRDLTKGVRLSAEVPTARVLDVRARRDAIVMRAAASGSAALHVNRAPTIRRARTASR